LGLLLALPLERTSALPSALQLEKPTETTSALQLVQPSETPWGRLLAPLLELA